MMKTANAFASFEDNPITGIQPLPTNFASPAGCGEAPRAVVLACRNQQVSCLLEDFVGFRVGAAVGSELVVVTILGNPMLVGLASYPVLTVGSLGFKYREIA